MVIGQEKICGIIDRYTIDMFPRSLMLVGTRGSGKHLICNHISSKFNLSIVDITDNLTLESIEELYNRVEPFLYLIKVNEISVKEQNTILKFLEEPLKNSYIVLLAETEMGILSTILNRCQVWHLQNYKKEYLKTFLDGESEGILKIASTPGQVMELKNSNFNSMVNLADKIIDNISVASVTNTLTLSNKITFKEEKNKYNGKLFIDILVARILEKYKETNNRNLIESYCLANILQQNVRIKNLDYICLFEKFLIDFRCCMRNNK